MISIIVPVFCAEQYLERCISSIVNQTNFDLELILVDDGSPDCSGEICDKWKMKDSRIRVIHQNNSGVCAARNHALSIAKGDFVCFVDSDDWLEKDCIQIMLEAAQRTNADIVCVNRFDEGIDSRVNYRYSDALISREEALDCFSSYYFTTVWGKLFSRKSIRGLQFREDLYYSEDTLFYTQAVNNSKSIYWMSKPLYHYFINPNGAMKKVDLEKRTTDFDARCAIVEIYHEFPELRSGAICRAVSTAFSIDKMALNNNIEHYSRENEIRNYLKHNRLIYLRSPNIPLKAKLIVFLYSFETGKKLNRLMQKHKHNIAFKQNRKGKGK